MDDIKLLTVKDVSIRWQKDEQTIRRYIEDGILTPCKGVPGKMFHPNHIYELEGVKLETISPLKVKALNNKMEKLERENRILKQQFKKFLDLSCESIKLADI